MANKISEFNASDIGDGVMLDSLDSTEIAGLLLSTATAGDLREIMAHNLEMCKVSTKATHIRWFTDLLKTIMEVKEQERLAAEGIPEETLEQMLKRLVANQLILDGYGDKLEQELQGYLNANLR